MKAIISIVCGVILIWALWETMGQRGSKIHFVVPDGYRGIFKIREAAGGAPVEKKIGVYEYRIPTNGILQCTTTKPLKWVFQESAEFASGKKLDAFPIGSYGAPLTNETKIYLFSLSGDSDGWFYQLVGTEKEYSEVQKTSIFEFINKNKQRDLEKHP